MPINDSAGVGVHLIDKSQRASVAIGFRSAGAIEADRGLCNAPTLISSEEDYVRTFGSPSMERHGLAAMEAYLLAQRKVPQVLTRAKNPEMAPNATSFGLMKFAVEEGKLTLNTSMPASSIGAPVDANEVLLYFKGEGDYCRKHDTNEETNRNDSNVVVRFSKPATQSAYAKDGHALRMQVFDFDGVSHIDEDIQAEFAFNPDVKALIDPHGKLKLDGYVVDDTSDAEVTTTAFVNGRVKTLPAFGYNTLSTSADGMFGKFSEAVKGATYADGKYVIDPEWDEDLAFQYLSGDSLEDSSSGDDSDKYGYYVLYSAKSINDPQELNCFGLSIALTTTVELPIVVDPNVGRPLASGFYSYPCGSVTISKKTRQVTDEEGHTTTETYYTAKFNIRTNLYLKNRNSYMFMGKQNEYWASYYSAYCKEDYTFSLSYDDYDANYISMQADATLGGSKYLVSKSSETFMDYPAIQYDDPNEDITARLHYFEGAIVDNKISQANRSYAYSQALVTLLGDNLTRRRCLATPNLGDVMTQADFISAITAAGESTLGISNIGRAASVDVFGNLTGRHGNRFIADYSQYAYRTLAGKRTAVTMAVLVTDLLNSHYNEGIESRPPFGYNYGQISCLGLSQQFSGAEREMLARQYKINPVIEDGGYFIWEERTSQLTDTSLSDIHCIISFIWMKFAIYDAMKAFVAEYNDEATVNRGLTLLNQLNQTFISRNYIEEGIVSADKNVIGDEVLRFDYAIRFKGVARFVDVYITAYSQTQTLSVSLAQEA